MAASHTASTMRHLAVLAARPVACRGNRAFLDRVVQVDLDLADLDLGLAVRAWVVRRECGQDRLLAVGKVMVPGRIPAAGLAWDQADTAPASADRGWVTRPAWGHKRDQDQAVGQAMAAMGRAWDQAWDQAVTARASVDRAKDLAAGQGMGWELTWAA